MGSERGKEYFRPSVITYRLADGSYRTPDGKRVTKNTPGAVRADPGHSEVWYGKFTDNSGAVHRVKLCANKTASKQMLAKIVTDTALAERGMADPAREEQSKRTLADHLADFEANLKAKGNTAKQVALQIGRIRRLLAGCRFTYIADLSALIQTPNCESLYQAVTGQRLVAVSSVPEDAVRKTLNVLNVRSTLSDLETMSSEYEYRGHGHDSQCSLDYPPENLPR